MTLKTLSEDQVVVSRVTPPVSMGFASGGSNPKGVDGGSDADQGTDAGSSDQGTSDHSADSDSGRHDTSESGSTTTTPIAPDSSDRAPSQPR